MKNYSILSGLRKCHRRILKVLTLVVLAFGLTNVHAQHVFSVSYNELSQENTRQISTQIERARTAIALLSRNMSGEYVFSLSSTQNTKIVPRWAEAPASVRL